MESRRKFIEKAAMLSAGTMVLPACGGGKAKENPIVESVQEQIKTEIGLQLYTLRDLIAKDLPGTIEAVAELGFNYVESYGYGDRQYFGLPASDFYAMLKSNGLSLRSSHHTSGRVVVENQGTLINGWEQAVEDAASGGQEFMVCAYLFDTERSVEDYAALPDILNTAGEICKTFGIQFCYHNHDFEFVEMNGVIPMYDILDKTDPDLVKVELDMYWISKINIDAVDFFKKYPGRIPLWHVKDMADTEEREFTEVGNGVVDYKTIFENAGLAGMKYFFVEQDISTDPMKSIETSYKYLANMI